MASKGSTATVDLNTEVAFAFFLFFLKAVEHFFAPQHRTMALSFELRLAATEIPTIEYQDQ
jgi:hypothetical protein